jgi:hypothetical protein
MIPTRTLLEADNDQENIVGLQRGFLCRSAIGPVRWQHAEKIYFNKNDI